MKHLNRFFLSLSFVLLVSLPTFAQDEIDQLLGKSAEDGEKLIGAYIAPFMKSVSSGLNQGWYNTAKPHKLIGIDITITANAMTIPNSDLYYNVAALKLQTIEQDETSAYSTSGNVPTIFGAEKAPMYRFKDDPTSTPFEGPGGIDLKGNLGMNAIPVPMAQIGIGLPKGTDLKFRYVPTLDLGDDSQFKMFGIGVMHDIKQWIPGLKLMPFDLSGFVGYTKLSINSKFPEDDNTLADGENQGAEMSMTATTIQGIISKKISVLTVYGGLGYNIAKAKLGVKGTYDFNDDGDTNDSREVNPFNLSYTTSGPRMTAGFRLKLAILTLHADYTLQKYRCLTAGVGLSIR